jgi:hypothetical protein
LEIDMNITRRTVTIASLGLLAGTSMRTPARGEFAQGLREFGEGLDDFQVAQDAYIYGYPLVTMEMTRRVVTNVTGFDGTRGPMGQIIKLRQYPDALFRDVTAADADTLYTTAFLDVGKEPWLLSIPDMKDRYYRIPMLDGWTEVFAVPGQHTTGGGAQTYAITGPGWNGTLPAGVEECRSPTSIVYLLGHICCTGTAKDYAAVHALQDQFELVPLSAYGKSYTPPAGTVDLSIDVNTPIREQVSRLDAKAYFTLFAQLMKTNPPDPADGPELARFAKIGLVPGQDFDANKLNADFAKRIPEIAFDRIMLQFEANKAVEDANGWNNTKTGSYGTDYFTRALVAAMGLGANRIRDAVYLTSLKDPKGNAYRGANNYVVRFAKDQLAPGQDFWSLTMYDDGYFFVPNPINRYSISAWQKLQSNADGSVDIYVQKDSPGTDKESNWLPAPAGKFALILRLYSPNEPAPPIVAGS